MAWTSEQFSHVLDRTLSIKEVPVDLVEFVYFHDDLYTTYKASKKLNCVLLALDLIHSSFEKEACNLFAMYNNLPVLQFLYRKGFDWDEGVLFYACINNSLDCIQFALNKECPIQHPKNLLQQVMQSESQVVMFLVCSFLQQKYNFEPDFWTEMANLQRTSFKKQFLLRFALIAE